MKRILVALCALLLLWPSAAYADEIIVIELLPTATPTPAQLTPPPPTPTPTPRPELPVYAYSSSWARGLSRGIWSVCPMNLTWKTKQAFCELVLNRIDDDSGDFEDTPSTVLAQGREFLDYDSDAFRSRENDEVADYTIRAWMYANITGDWSYRLVPADGLYCDFYDFRGWDYIKIYNRAGDVVYDSGPAIQ